MSVYAKKQFETQQKNKHTGNNITQLKEDDVNQIIDVTDDDEKDKEKFTINGAD